MAYYRKDRGALWIGPESGWGDGSAALVYVKTKEIKTSMGMEYNDPQNITQSDVEDQGSILYQPGDCGFKMGLHPFTSTWPSAAPLIGNKPPVSEVLESLLGGTKAGGYGVTTTGNTTTVLQFDNAGDSPTTLGFVEGEGVFVREPSAANVLGYNVISDVDDAAFTITLRSPLPSAPADASIVYGGFSNPKLASSSSSSYEVIWKGESTTDIRQHLACIPSAASLSAPYRGLAELDVTYRSARPVPMDLVTTHVPADQAYAYPEAAQVLFGGLYLYDGVTSHKLTGGIDIDFGVESADVAGIHGVDPNGVADILLNQRKIRVKVNPAYADNALIDLFENPPASAVLTGWWGRGSRPWGFQIPAAVIAAPPEFGDDGGILNHGFEIGTGAYTGDTGSGGESDAADKPFVISVLAG